jgi:hypothetical protein
MVKVTKTPAQSIVLNSVIFAMAFCCSESVRAQSADVCDNADLKASVVQSINEANPDQNVKDLIDAEFVSRNGRQSLTCRYTVKFVSGASVKVLGIATSTSDGSIDLDTKFEN